ncbi:DsbA family protein [Bradyrhizobium sp. CIAT3101]|uniref:2-hydroxychromene-2-carboxylate isomerase n=1 Tax=Bradyrhizobium sp. CIAT3101 TaxID=439387 RepID=UPI0024B0509F|nr:DsbA family protein [Bradyrhizobium sp. CIAT3101]WFU82477.1 DsbA family protein [Bradyrhizobium sp. CIAT3101]
MTKSLTLYADYRSPFSYLAKDEAYALEKELGVTIAWRPFAVDIESAYGGTVEERTERDWRKVRYSYMDARRLANRRGLIVRGPQKIYNGNNVHIGMLHAQRAGNDVFRRYHDEVYERFWCRDLEIEDLTAVRDVLVKAGADGAAYEDLVRSGEGLREYTQVVAEAEERGVFGVPTFVVDETGELFWGTDRLWLLREWLEKT